MRLIFGGLPTALARAIDALEGERVAWAVLGTGMVLSALLGLWLTRGTTFHSDDFLYLIANRGFDPRVLIAPHNGGLILIPRLIYAVVLKLVGAPHYVVFRLVEVVGVAGVAGLYFTLAKRRIGTAAALAPSILLLFFGSAWQDSLDPVGIAHVYCAAAGLTALLALDRRTLRRDLGACVALVAAVATFSSGLAFVVGAAASILLGPDRRRRVWIVVVPLALYVAWFLAPKLNTPPFSTGTGLELSNVLVIPAYIAAAASALAAAVTGLGYDFANPATYTIDSPLGFVLAALGAAALIARLRHGPVPRSFWVPLVVLLAFWVSAALVSEVLTRGPDQDRYVYDAGVVALLVAAEAARGMRISRGGLLTLYALTTVALMGNLAVMRAGANYLRASTASDRAELAAVEIARNHVDPRFVPQGEPRLAFLDDIAGGAAPYLAAVARNGTFAFTLPALRRQHEAVRELADATLAAALRLALTPAPAPPAGVRCLLVRHRSGPLDIALRAPGIVLRSPVSEPAALRRFASVANANVGQLSAGNYVSLRIPSDLAPDPWHLVIPDAGGLRLCPL